MITKLTLTIERSLIEKAKQHAKSQGSSLSEMVSNYLKKLDKQTMEDAVVRTPITRSLKGSFKAPENFNYKKALPEELGEKYL
jgi:hypothetical protein